MDPRDPGARLLLVGDAVERARKDSAVFARVWGIISVPWEDAFESRDGRPISQNQHELEKERDRPHRARAGVAYPNNLPNPEDIFGRAMFIHRWLMGC